MDHASIEVVVGSEPSVLSALTWCPGWEVIAEDETKEADNHGSLANLDSSPGTSGHKMGHGSSGKSTQTHTHGHEGHCLLG